MLIGIAAFFFAGFNGQLLGGPSLCGGVKVTTFTFDVLSTILISFGRTGETWCDFCDADFTADLVAHLAGCCVVSAVVVGPLGHLVTRGRHRPIRVVQQGTRLLQHWLVGIVGLCLSQDARHILW